MDQEVYIQVQGEEREQELHHFMEMLNKGDNFSYK